MIKATNSYLIEATQTSHEVIQPRLTFPLYYSTSISSANLQNRKFHKNLTPDKLQNSPATVNYQQNIPITEASNSNNPPQKREGKRKIFQHPDNQQAKKIHNQSKNLKFVTEKYRRDEQGNWMVLKERKQ